MLKSEQIQKDEPLLRHWRKCSKGLRTEGRGRGKCHGIKKKTVAGFGLDFDLYPPPLYKYIYITDGYTVYFYKSTVLEGRLWEGTDGKCVFFVNCF